MVIRVNPQTMSPSRSQARQLGLQDAVNEFNVDRQMIDAAQADLGGVLDYMDDKHMLEILSQGGLDNQEAATQFQNDFANANPQNVGQIAQNRLASLNAQGVPSDDTQEIVQLEQVAPQQAMQGVTNINQMLNDPRIRNYLARNPTRARQTMAAFAPQKSTNELDAWKLKEDYKLELANNKNLREKKYSEIEKANTSIDKDISGINKNYSNVQNLLKVATDPTNVKGARQAVYGLIVSLVKLGDPNSAVLASEAASALNIQGIESAILSGDTDVIKEALKGKLDALDPKNIDAAGIMKVADAYKAAGVSDLSQRYDYTEEQRGLLGEKGKAFTGSTKRKAMIDKLNKSVNPYTVGESYTDANGNTAIYQKDGTFKVVQ